MAFEQRQPRNKMIAVKLPVEELRLITDAAKRHKLRTSEWARQVLAAAVPMQEAQPAGKAGAT